MICDVDDDVYVDDDVDVVDDVDDVDDDVYVDDDVDVVDDVDDVDDVFLLAGLDRSTLELLNEEDEDPKCLKIWLRWRF